MLKGRIFSIETMGLVDGPGIRVVVFFQGCKLRCKFCHNPESWNFDAGNEYSTDELLNKILRFRPYFKRSGGGVTFSGGEPLMQPEFLLEMLKLCRQAGIHTCIDTSGVGFGDYDEILTYTDLVLYDVKAVGESQYKYICGVDIFSTEEFQKSLVKNNSKVIVRQVVIPEINNTDEYMLSLKKYIAENIPTAEKVELLPYHMMGVHKYAKLGIDYPLTNTPQADKESVRILSEKYFK